MGLINYVNITFFLTDMIACVLSHNFDIFFRHNMVGWAFTGFRVNAMVLKYCHSFFNNASDWV